jgi:DNA-binding transcriptional ArsR family regulator/uncharacterized protein YndB with AHSA1/START domain
MLIAAQEPLADVWKALSDPTRRAILDRLREEPMTTGALADLFPTSRFAVMKHLAVLEAARLVLARKQGREKWNHLNAAPIQQLYERWVKPYEGEWAARLTDFKRRLEGRDHGAAQMAKSSETTCVEYELEIRIEAPRERVWKALVEDTTLWWRKDFYVGKEPRGFHIEPKLGGRVWEDWGNGAGLIWFTVIGCDPGRSLRLRGDLMSDCTGSSGQTLMHWQVVPDGKSASVLKLSDAVMGRLSANMGQSLADGWKLLLGETFKQYVEAK